jgi:hypothetical protein
MVEKFDAFGENRDDVSLIVVLNVGADAYELAERYYNDDGTVTYGHYVCPIEQFEGRELNKVAEKHYKAAEMAEKCIEADSLTAIRRIETNYGIR